MTKIVQKKLNEDEELNKLEKKWLKRYAKRYPELAPKKVQEEKVEKEPEIAEEKLSKTEELLTLILSELKNAKEDETAKNQEK